MAIKKNPLTAVVSGGATEPYIEETYDADGNLTTASLHGYTEIRPYCFYQQQKLSSLDFGNKDDIEDVRDYAFYGCKSLVIDELPIKLTVIKTSSFYYCSKITITSLQDEITEIKSNSLAYTKCSSLRYLPRNLVNLENTAFSFTGLTSITFRSTPTIIGLPFYNCSTLTEINVPWSEGEVAGAPWGATMATINYDYVEV